MSVKFILDDPIDIILSLILANDLAPTRQRDITRDNDDANLWRHLALLGKTLLTPIHREKSIL